MIRDSIYETEIYRDILENTIQIYLPISVSICKMSSKYIYMKYNVI